MITFKIPVNIAKLKSFVSKLNGSVLDLSEVSSKNRSDEYLLTFCFRLLCSLSSYRFVFEEFMI